MIHFSCRNVITRPRRPAARGTLGAFVDALPAWCVRVDVLPTMTEIDVLQITFVRFGLVWPAANQGKSPLGVVVPLIDKASRPIVCVCCVHVGPTYAFRV